MIVPLTRRGIGAYWHTLTKAKGARVKRGTATALATLDEALDVARGPAQGRNGQGVLVDLEGTGVGYDEFRFDDAGVELDAGTAATLKEFYDGILDGEEGYPAEMARGVKELGEALTKWTAKVSGRPEGTPSEPSPAPAPEEAVAP